MGAEHLIRGLSLALLVGACASSARPVAPPGALAPSARHVQIVRALPSAERVALAERFRARNGPWIITLGASDTPDDVDPIRRVVRRATRTPASLVPREITSESAVREAAAFLARNADFLGFSATDVPALDVEAGPAKTATYGAWVVHARGASPMRGYEGFASLTSAIDVLLYIGEDGAVRYFVNLSRVQPRLSIDTSPRLGPDDARVRAKVVGRPVFAVLEDPARPDARARELRRLPLGFVRDGDVRAIRLVVHVSPGPRLAYVSYSLAYAVEVVKDRLPFRFVVDADTGDLLEDAEVPVVPEPSDETLRD